MTPGTLVFLEGAVTFGIPVLFAVRELFVHGRGGGPGRFDGPRDDAPAPPLPGSEPHAPSLPDCLVPAMRADPAARQTKRNPVLEPV